MAFRKKCAGLAPVLRRSRTCCAPPAGTIAVAWAARRGFISANIGCTRASAAFTALGSKADSRSFLALGGDRRR
eukprot:4827225-Pleurochrysis_carterae.AAC.5